MIERLLPSTVVVETVRGDERGADLLPEEMAHVRHAVERRQREYAIGRTCARRALKRLGFENVPIPTGAKREPVWPAGVVGSITHCEGYCAAAVALARDFTALGIDAEPDGPLPPGILDHVSLPQERARIAGAASGVHWDRLLFSAKEAVYKAYFPLTGAWLGFEQAELTFHGDRTFEARLLVEPLLVGARLVDTFHGHYAVGDGLVITAIALSV